MCGLCSLLCSNPSVIQVSESYVCRSGRLNKSSLNIAQRREGRVWHWICINIEFACHHCLSIHYKYLFFFILPLPIFASSTLSAIPVCFTLSLLTPKCKKKTLSKSDLNQAEETMSHKESSTLFHSHPDLHPSGSREIFGERTWVEGGSKRRWEEAKKREVCRKRRAEEHVSTPLCMVNHREKAALQMPCLVPGTDRQKWKKWLQKCFFIEGMLGSH